MGELIQLYEEILSSANVINASCHSVRHTKILQISIKMRYFITYKLFCPNMKLRASCSFENIGEFGF